MRPPGNNLALILVATWVWTGFCLVILFAATIPVMVANIRRFRQQEAVR